MSSKSITDGRQQKGCFPPLSHLKFDQDCSEWGFLS